MLVGRHRCLSTMQIASVPGKRARLQQNKTLTLTLTLTGSPPTCRLGFLQH